MAEASHDKGILIIGAPRSGTTLLRRLLDAHSQIACPGETNMFTGCARLLQTHRSAEGLRVGVVPGLGFAGFDRNEVLDRLRTFAFSFHRDYAARQNKRRWAEKTPFDAFHLDEIEELCAGHVHFICIVRHALDVVCSIKELCDMNQGYLPELHAYIRRYPRFYEAFAHAWVDTTRRIRTLVAQHPETAMMFRYEQLVDDPTSIMQQVLEFVGEQWEDGLLDRSLQRTEGLGPGDWKTYSKSAIDAKSVGRWNALPRATISELAAIVNPTLIDCGYEPVVEEPQLDDEAARRRYELSMMLQAARKQSDD